MVRQGLRTTHFQQWGKAKPGQGRDMIQAKDRRLEEEGRKSRAMELGSKALTALGIAGREGKTATRSFGEAAERKRQEELSWKSTEDRHHCRHHQLEDVVVLAIVIRK